MQQLVGLPVIDDSLVLRVPVDPGFCGERCIGQQGKSCRAVPCFHIAVGSLTALDTVTEVSNVLGREISVYFLAFEWLDPRVGLLELPAF